MRNAGELIGGEEFRQNCTKFSHENVESLQVVAVCMYFLLLRKCHNGMEEASELMVFWYT